MNSEPVKTLKDRIGYVLDTLQSSRNDDKILIEEVCGRYGYDPLRKASSIERCRRWYQERGQYLPTLENVARQRKMNIDEWKEALGYGRHVELPF